MTMVPDIALTSRKDFTGLARGAIATRSGPSTLITIVKAKPAKRCAGTARTFFAELRPPAAYHSARLRLSVPDRRLSDDYAHTDFEAQVSALKSARIKPFPISIGALITVLRLRPTSPFSTSRAVSPTQGRHWRCRRPVMTPARRDFPTSRMFYASSASTADGSRCPRRHSPPELGAGNQECSSNRQTTHLDDLRFRSSLAR